MLEKVLDILESDWIIEDADLHSVSNGVEVYDELTFVANNRCYCFENRKDSFKISIDVLEDNEEE